MSNRLQKIGELLKREISTVVKRDFEFPDLLVTIQHVDVAPDLRTAKVFVGVFGEEGRRTEVISKLTKARGAIQSQMMKRVVLRNTPRLSFDLDDSIERGVRMVNILDDLGEIPEYDEEGNKIEPNASKDDDSEVTKE
ncbi:UNVERIFIED_CONTAM: hypothetical protein GTU68_019742 [Idotea baltica]|nr:hypothetical protein [Idotea baltica]